MHKVGDRHTWERTFTEEDVRDFTRLSGDAQRRHVERDAEGRLMVQGLLTASIPTKIGGDIGFLARRFEIEFMRPVYVGDTVRCELRVDEVTADKPGRVRLVGVATCSNQRGEEVLRMQFRGVVLDA